MTITRKTSGSIIGLVLFVLLCANSSLCFAQEETANDSKIPLIYQKLNGDLKRDNRILKAQRDDYQSSLRTADKAYIKYRNLSWELEDKLRDSVELHEEAKNLAETLKDEVEILKNRLEATFKKADAWITESDQRFNEMCDRKNELLEKQLQLEKELKKKLESESQKLVSEADLMLTCFLSDQKADEVRLFAGNTYLRQTDQYPTLRQTANKKEVTKSLKRLLDKHGEKSELGTVAKKILQNHPSGDLSTENPFD